MSLDNFSVIRAASALQNAANVHMRSFLVTLFWGTGGLLGAYFAMLSAAERDAVDLAGRFWFAFGDDLLARISVWVAARMAAGAALGVLVARWSLGRGAPLIAGGSPSSSMRG